MLKYSLIYSVPSGQSGQAISPQTIEPSQHSKFVSPPHTPHSSTTAVEPQALSQPDGPASPQPQPASILPSQSHAPSAIPSPPHTPHSSFSKVEPQALSQPEGPASKQPQPTSSEPSPPHTPHASFSKVEPQALLQPEGPASPHPQLRGGAEARHL